MYEILANISIIGATTMTVVFLLPQMVKLIRTKDSAGVSSTWPVFGFVINVGWFLYMISQQFWTATLAPLVTFISYGVILWALASTGRQLRSSYMRGLGLMAVLIAVGVFGGWGSLGIALGLSYSVQLAPSIWTAYRTSDPSGISPSTWWIGLAEAALWGIFGQFHGDVGIVTFSVVGVAGAALMLVRYYTTRRRAQVSTRSRSLSRR
jgi:uncharacterized protein with PQ loop repeat